MSNISGNQSSDIRAKLKKLKEEEKILVKLLQRVDEQLNCLRVEEMIIRRHFRRSDGTTESMFTTDLPITDGTEQTSNSEAEMGTEATLHLEVDEVLRALVQNGNDKSNQQEVEEEDEDSLHQSFSSNLVQ